ncbi:NAD(P)/FAD-dependent oxidoreductase [Streptomyces lichenis]|uniref:FAD-dependent oxidoreductase n=1 Tax=Streptomyces lichenis TaxID=2306967 RepID=A0ABT0IET2_9ACTN|nr:FAD-dependent oxidoreductase [Streptomyces lichenis]MCK8679801.1 FAD-dependent oxidoreductase [Streptomyces lichenis]
MAEKTEVVVVGGGYAGVMAANRLARRDEVAVTLVNPRRTFVERIRLHQLAGGTDDAVVEYRRVLAGRVRLEVDTVTRIDAAGRRLETASGGTVGYDYLVYAVGSGSADLRVPGAAEFAYPIATLEEAERLRPALDALPARAPVTVVGAGPTGIETAAELAEAGRAVTLVCGGVLGPYLHPRGRRAVARRLARLGVTVLAGPGTEVTAVTPEAVRLGDGRELPSRVTVWSAGFGVPDLAARSGLSTDALGRLRTDTTLTSVDDPRIVAAGDAAAPAGLTFRMSCQAAVQLGPAAADTVLSRIAGSPPATVDVLFTGQCLSLGRRGGVIQTARRDDTVRGLHLAARPGATLKELVCRGTLWRLAYEARGVGRGERGEQRRAEPVS